MAIYQMLNGSFELNKENWNRYVNSKELFDIVYPLMCDVSNCTRGVMCDESIDCIGNKILADNQIYFAVPEIRNTPSEEDLRIAHYASVCFITMLNHMFFRYLYQEPFVILKGSDDSIKVRLNEKLEYELVEVCDESEYVAISDSSRDNVSRA
ncbi:MAG: hypothetical protein ABH881_01985 [bacterium]